MAGQVDVSRRMQSKLGVCRRCMTLTGLLVLAFWTATVLLAASDHPAGVLLVGAAAAAVPMTVLAIAHAVAFRVRRRCATAVEPQAAAEAPQARRGGCGCGG